MRESMCVWMLVMTLHPWSLRELGHFYTTENNAARYHWHHTQDPSQQLDSAFPKTPLKKIDSPVLFMPWQSFSFCNWTRRRWEVRWLSYPPVPHIGVVVMRWSAVPLPRVSCAVVVVGSSILECALRFGRGVSSTWRLPAFFPEQSVSLKLPPETPRSVEVSSRHVVFLLVRWER